MAEKLIFPIGFDLEEGVAKVEKDWGKMQKRLQDTFKSQTIQVDADISKAVLDKLYAKFEGLIKTMESKAPQIKLKIPDTVDFEQEINRLKVQLKSINLGELTDAESKDLYLYIRQLEALAKALKEVNKQEQLRQANRPEVIALRQAQAEEKRTRAIANSALAEQRRAKIATETARQNEINNRSAQRSAVIAEQKRAATARAEQAELRLTQAKQRSTDATERQNAAYKIQSGYLQRLFQRMVAYASVTQAFSFLRNIREVTAQFELQRVALGSIIGDLNEANAMFEQIKAAAVKSPFQIKELVTYTKQLAAYKIETDELFETTQRLADVSAGLGVGMERLVLAYGQIRATGYLRASEVRQLTEAGIPIVEELAKKMSQLRGEMVSAAEVMGMISERAISFGMVKEVFDDMTSAGGMFYKMQEKQAETLAGQWSNLQDSIAIMYEEIGNTEGVNNAIKSTIGLVKSLAENWRDVYSVAQSLSVAMGVYYVTMKNATMASMALSVAEATRLSTLRATTIYMPKFLASTKLAVTLTHAYRVAVIKSATATGLLSKAFWGLTKAMLSNPYTAVLAALAGITFAIVKFSTKTKTAQERIDDLNKSIASLTDLKDDVKPLVEELEALSQKTNKTAEEQKRLNQVTQELAKIYPEAIVGVREFGSEVELSTEKIKELYEAERQAVEEGLKIKLQANEEELKKEEARLARLNKALVDKTYTETSYGFGGSSTTTTYKYTTEELEELAKQADESREKIASLNNSIKEGRVALGLQKSDLEEAVDNFNTWQKELASITEGKNLKGKGIRLFDDESITQINKLTDATARVAEEYDKLAKEKKEVDKALKSEGAKADKDTYAKLQERLGKINEGMSGLYGFLKKYGALDLIKSDDKTKKSAEQALKDELATVEKIYKRYQDLRKLKSETDTQSILANEFKGVSLTTLSKAYSPKQMLEVYQKALAEAQRLGKKDLVLEIQTIIGEFNIAEEQRKLEKSLKDLSDKISRTKTAKEFFDRMLGMTGDKQLSATLTMSVYGEGGDLGKKLAEQTIEQLETAFEGVDISSAIDKTTGKVDYAKLAPLVEQLPEKAQANAQALVKAGEKANADWLIDLQKTYQKAFTFEERRTQVMKEEAQKRKEIEESTSLTPEQKAKYTEASQKKEAERISAINIEEFKESEDYLKIFEDIERLSIPTIERLIAKLREVIATNKELSATDLKHLTEQINKLEDGLVKKDAWAGLLSGIRDLQKARKTISQTAKGTKEYADAMDDANKANVKIQNALGGLQSEFSQAQQLIESFADTLGIAEDSDFGVFLNGMAEAIGGVSKALAFAQLAVQLFDGTIKSFLASNPIGWILLIVSAIISAVQAIMNARVNRINKEIERLQDHLDNLEYSFDRLQKAQEKAFGNDYINNYERQLENLEAQQEAYLKQAELERSKGKKADENKIKEYENQARDTADAIKDMYGSLSEHFLGQDLASAARDFASAWIDAYKEFSNTTDAMKAKFQDMIQNMVVESLLAKVMEKALEPVFTMIDEMGDGDFYSTRFWQDVMTTMQTATENGVVGAENVMSMLEQMGINLRGLGGEMTGISRDIATASEESILGLAAGINTQNFYISQVPTKLDTIIGLLRGDGAMPQGSAMTLQDVMIAQNQFLSHLPTIAQHTAETVAECKQIVAETRRTADALDRVIKPDGTRTTYKMNVVTSYQG